MSDEAQPPKDQTPQGDQKPPKEQKPKGEVNPFWLETVFPDPAAIFAFDSPSPVDLAAECVFALDTNVLLAPYELGPDSFNDIERIYKGLAKHDRLFVPAQAAREYAKNRGTKISQVYQAVNDRQGKMPSTGDLKCPILEGVAEYEEVKKKIEELRPKTSDLSEALLKLKEALTNWGWKDKVSTLYRELFTKQRIIDHDKKRDEVLKDLAFRTTHTTPPSYKDAGKPDGGIGDLLIWHSLLALGKRQHKSVVFVCNDEKADWSIRSSGDAVLPRSELTLEFHRETGQKLAIMNWKRFLKSMNAAAKTIDEAEVLETRFSPIGERVKGLLQILASIFEKYLEDFDHLSEEERFIGDDRFPTLVEEIPKVVELFNRVSTDTRLILTLNRLTDMLDSIDADQHAIGYILARMKYSAEQPQARMKTKIQAFLVFYDEYLTWVSL